MLLNRKTGYRIFLGKMESTLNYLPECMSKLGVQSVYVSPGSRNAPIIRALVENRSFRMYSVFDERSAGFMALGASQATQKPVALLCTSGTALVNYYPAIIEAFYSQIPLLVLSADRPAHLIDQWEGQCIRQNGIFEGHIGPTLLWNEEPVEQIFPKANDALSRGKPVHINIPLEEPLYAQNASPLLNEHHFDGTQKEDNNHEPPFALIRAIENAERILIVNGNSNIEYTFPELPVPILNDLLSAKKASSDSWNWESSFLRAPKDLPEPQLLIGSGTSILSKGLRNWLRSVPGLKQWHIGTQKPIGDPYFTKPEVWEIHEGAGFERIEKLLNLKTSAYAQDLKAHLKRKNDMLRGEPFTFAFCLEYFVSRMPVGSVVQLANSSAVRWVSWLGLKSKDVRFYANRGSSGIDGCSSTALGFAQNTAKDVYLITGDIAFFYDINALFSGEGVPKNLKIILLNDGGGGIFHWLKGPSDFPEVLPYQTTPHHRDASWICRDANLGFLKMNAAHQVREAWEFLSGNGPLLLEVHAEMEANTGLFKSMAD